MLREKGVLVQCKIHSFFVVGDNLSSGCEYVDSTQPHSTTAFFAGHSTRLLVVTVVLELPTPEANAVYPMSTAFFYVALWVTNSPELVSRCTYGLY